jgi:hypothetical protein
MTNTNGFDDFDTQVTAEEFYRGEGYDSDTIEEFVKRDESLMGGKYHGPSNSAGMTRNEYWDSYYEWQDEQSRLRDEW